MRALLQIVCVENADEVLCEALVIERPEEFLKKPSAAPAEQPAPEAQAQA